MDRNAEMELERIPSLSNKKISIGTLDQLIEEEEKLQEDTQMLKSKEDLGSINVSVNISKDQEVKNKHMEKLRSSPALIVSRESRNSQNQELDNLTDLNREAQ